MPKIIRSVDHDAIPQELRELPRWACWQERPSANGKKPDKPPIQAGNPCTGRYHKFARCNDPSTWTSFNLAARYLQSLRNEKPACGLSFALNGDGIVGIDVDNCRNVQSKVIAEWAIKVIKRFGSYTELSPSGTGLRIFVRGKLPIHGRHEHKGQTEVYDSAKFLSVTGRKLTGHGAGDGIESRSAELLAWHREVFGAGTTSTKGNGSNGRLVIHDPPDLDQGRLTRLFQARPKAKALFDGALDGYPSPSEANLALANYATAAGWTAQETCDLLVAARHNAEEPIKPAAYFARTIAKARDGLPKALETVSVSTVSREGTGVAKFPLEVYPSEIGKYLTAGAQSIHCPVDLLAVPLLGIAGAAIGRAERRLKVKDGHTVSSCIWAAALDRSGGGKSPALHFDMNFFWDRQAALVKDWKDRKVKYLKDPKNNDPPGSYPALVLSDTTTESLQQDLQSGAVLYCRDELDGWCKQMGQYKKNNADRSDWCSFWSHLPVSIGRKSTERVFVKFPFVGVAGMMVPESLRYLNDSGHANDGFMHRLLLCYPEPMMPKVTGAGVSDELVKSYKKTMSRLFEGTKRILTFGKPARQELEKWGNEDHYAEVNKDTPGGTVAKFRKLWEYASRLSLVIHELRRVAGEAVDPDKVDLDTVRRALAAIDYFKAHLPRVQELLGETGLDPIDRAFNRIKSLRLDALTVREATHRGIAGRNAKRAEVLAVFGQWKDRGHGFIEQTRVNQERFVFKT